MRGRPLFYTNYMLIYLRSGNRGYTKCLYCLKGYSVWKRWYLVWSKPYFKVRMAWVHHWFLTPNLRQLWPIQRKQRITSFEEEVMCFWWRAATNQVFRFHSGLIRRTVFYFYMNKTFSTIAILLQKLKDRLPNFPDISKSTLSRRVKKARIPN